MRLPDLRNVVINGTPFVDLGGKAQTRFISQQMDAQKAKAAEGDPGALTAAERERLDAADAKLAEAMAAHESAVATWTDLKTQRWQGQHSTSLVDGIRRKVTGSFPTEAAIAVAEEAKMAAESTLQRTLIATNREKQEIDSARWWRRHEAERAESAKGR